MRISERLKRLLERAGFSGVVLYPALGAWRTDVRLDVYRWTGYGVAHSHATLPDGLRCCFSSWDTMTACVRKGIIVDREDSATWNFMVSPVVRK